MLHTSTPVVHSLIIKNTFEYMPSDFYSSLVSELVLPILDPRQLHALEQRLSPHFRRQTPFHCTAIATLAATTQDLGKILFKPPMH